MNDPAASARRPEHDRAFDATANVEGIGGLLLAVASILATWSAPGFILGGAAAVVVGGVALMRAWSRRARLSAIGAVVVMIVGAGLFGGGATWVVGDRENRTPDPPSTTGPGQFGVTPTTQPVTVGSTPSPAPATSTNAATTAPSAPPAGAGEVRRSGSATLKVLYGVDLDADETAAPDWRYDQGWGSPKGRDIFFVSPTTVYPGSGKILVVNAPPTYDTCRTATGYGDSLTGSQVRAGTHLCLITDEDRWAYVKITGVNRDDKTMTIQITVWN
ncbi:hypothetical protein ACFQX7_10855 [Luedemannella flava]|uniref:hypothetical protein n=1 Tax=Luedemannella flava TaxID=349316 RepID=UPI0031DE6911